MKRSEDAEPGATVRARLLEVDDSVDLFEYGYEQGWSDGLPIVPPTPERVALAVAATGRAATDHVCTYVERSRELTVEHIAVNAVMAGCRPEYTPVVLAIIEAMASDSFGLHAVNATTGGSAIAFVVNGPVRHRLGMNWRGNVLGSGNRANATIGRAVRLVQINALGSVSGAGNENATTVSRPILDRATLGQPGKYAGYHIVENEEDYPTLLPLHVERGFAADQSVVTLFGTGGHIQIAAHHESTAQEVVDTLSHYLVNSGRLKRFGQCVLVIPPEIADIIVRDGWTKADVRQGLYDGTRRSVGWVKRNGWSISAGLMDRRGAEVRPGDDDLETAIAGSPDDILLAVAGGPAGAFVHFLYQYGGAAIASQEIHFNAEVR